MTAAARLIARMRRRLEAAELVHLRTVVLELHERTEKAESALLHAEDTAEFWREQALTMQQAAADPEFATHRSIGLTKGGELLVVQAAA